MLVRQAEALDENRIVHFKKGKQLGAGYYIVEISSNSSSLFVAAYDVESSESFLITLPEKRANELMQEFSSSYELMADSLQVMNKRLYLLNPKYLAQQKAQEEMAGAQNQELGATEPLEAEEPEHMAATPEEGLGETEEVNEDEGPVEEAKGDPLDL